MAIKTFISTKLENIFIILVISNYYLKKINLNRTLSHNTILSSKLNLSVYTILYVSTRSIRIISKKFSSTHIVYIDLKKTIFVSDLINMYDLSSNKSLLAWQLRLVW